MDHRRGTVTTGKMGFPGMDRKWLWIALGVIFLLHLGVNTFIALEHREFFLHDDGSEYMELALSFSRTGQRKNMFPIVHHYADTLLNPATDALMIYGGLFPDLASSAGLTRNFAHTCGPAFYAWAKKNAPEALPMARAVLCHGTVPPGLDHYADESWGEGPKGWCFQRGARYMEGVRRATPDTRNPRRHRWPRLPTDRLRPAWPPLAAGR